MDSEQLLKNEPINYVVDSSTTNTITENGEEKYDTSASRLRFLNFSPDWIQQFGEMKKFLFVLCLFPLLSTAVAGGLIPVVLSTLQRRFSFDSTLAGLKLN